MQLKQSRFDSESVRLFGFEKSREQHRAKNVHQRQFLVPADATEEKIAVEKSHEAAKERDRLAISLQYAA